MKTAVITGCARGIGEYLARGFSAAGYQVYGIDLLENPYFQGDLAEQEDLDRFVAQIKNEAGTVDVLINNAMQSSGGIETANYEQFNRALHIGISAPFYLVQQLRKLFGEGAGVINILSTRMAQSQADTESYSAAKGGLRALSHALMVSLAGEVRVNSIVPGWIDTTGSEFGPEDRGQHPSDRVGTPDDILRAALFLADPGNRFINGAELYVDGGMSKRMIYHGDEGWTFTP
ncbi:MAG: SDR family oxidoreductase [Clostridia bacterium]|nr:SDR family oxidoreductase [Clostridia bacterium]NLF20873.1 SDR family oxidoreductase [Clostridiaceae bacterium]